MDKQHGHIIDYCTVIKRNDTHKNRDTAPHSLDCILYGFIYDKLAKENHRQKGVWPCRPSNTKEQWGVFGDRTCSYFDCGGKY